MSEFETPPIKKDEFVGVTGDRTHTIRTIRIMFRDGDRERVYFNRYLIGSCPLYNPDKKFAAWAQCLYDRGSADCGLYNGNPLNAADAERMKRYVVNLLLCPDATEEWEVDAAYEEVWPPKPKQKKEPNRFDAWVKRNWSWIAPTGAGLIVGSMLTLGNLGC